jgi:hypothetical protein
VLLLLLLWLFTLLCHPAHDEPSHQLQVRDNLAAMRRSVHEASCPDHAWALQQAAATRAGEMLLVPALRMS